ncbi:MurNAc alpha-1-phosphate uridylyltransferase [Novosphingobium kunmingense]|uniref:MurNAc alpha-1-phosphate uridylyltransferase n=1 Tax=Novosphingobium kunmingense TaxID=1211806 RepID=A0A2N0I395_9SPHN|nr:nucleotidyltransferase family protein [Novosphingobium kunmingense]PKB25664.1 MurNAc alpha-1-phosphate uridylyltransferase [Novosphingobium kunmingense]
MSEQPGTAMIMAAGKGTRMMPLTASRPKPLVEVAGTTLLDHVLDLLRNAGVGRIVVNVHYFAEQIEAHLATHARDFTVAVSDERDLLRDTGGGLVKALPLIEGDPFFCINADNWFADTDEHALHRMAAMWDAERMDVLMLVVPTERAGNTQGTGDFDMDADGRLSRDGPKRPRPFVWTGIQMLARKVVTDPPSDVFSTNLFWDRAIAQGRCFGLVHEGAWFDVGYPEAIGLTEAALSGD